MERMKRLTDLKVGELRSFGCLWIERKTREKRFVSLSYNGNMGTGFDKIDECLKETFVIDNSLAKIKKTYKVVNESGYPDYHWEIKVEI